MKTLLMLLQMMQRLLNTSQVFFKPLTTDDNGVFKDVKLIKLLE